MSTEQDFLKELASLGVTARIKRLSDNLSASIRELYKATGVDLEPSWHLVLLLLRDGQAETMSDIADRCNISQPAATKMISRLIRKGYVAATPDRQDRRRKVLRLTVKAKRQLPRFEVIWRAGRLSVEEILRSNQEFLRALSRFEAELLERSFAERAMQRLDQDSRKR